MEEIGALTAAIREEGLNVPVAYGESARRFHTIKAYIDAGVQVIQPLPQFYCMAEQLRAIDYARSRGCRITSGQIWNGWKRMASWTKNRHCCQRRSER